MYPVQQSDIDSQCCEFLSLLFPGGESHGAALPFLVRSTNALLMHRLSLSSFLNYNSTFPSAQSLWRLLLRIEKARHLLLAKTCAPQLTIMSDTRQMQHVSASDARTFITNVLIGNGVPKDNALLVARYLVEADLRGVDTHGMNRIPSYMARIRAGVLDARASPTLQQVTPVVAQVDGKNAFGFLTGHTGMSAAIKMADKFGIGMVSCKHSNHFGMSAWLVQQALDAGMMSLVFTNSSPALPVWGGKSKLMGVSPIACGAPAGKHGRPFILDMAPSVAARGKIYKALRRGDKIPLDWALNTSGKRTDDPAEALEGVMLPMGGPKGSALAIMMDVFSGVLSGSAFAGQVTNPYDPSKAADVGHLLLAIKPDLFMSIEAFGERMDYLYAQVVGSDKMDGIERIYFPGEIEDLQKERRLKEGIPLVPAEVEALNTEAARVGCAPIVTTPPPTKAHL